LGPSIELLVTCKTSPGERERATYERKAIRLADIAVRRFRSRGDEVALIDAKAVRLLQ
jgi:hypothetical protein